MIANQFNHVEISDISVIFDIKIGGYYELRDETLDSAKCLMATV